MRVQVAVCGLIVMGAVSARVQAVEPVPARATSLNIARVMALAEADLQLRRAELGLIGASLPGLPESLRVPDPSAREAKPVKQATTPPAARADKPARPALLVSQRH